MSSWNKGVDGSGVNSLRSPKEKDYLKRSERRRSIIGYFTTGFGLLVAVLNCVAKKQFVFDELTVFGLIISIVGVTLSTIYSEMAANSIALRDLASSLELIREEVKTLESLTGLGTSVVEFSSSDESNIFHYLLRSRLKAVTADIQSMARGRYEFSSKSRIEDYADEFQRVMGNMLGEEVLFRTVTNAVFWSSLGVNFGKKYMGSMLSCLRLYRSLKIERVFVVPSKGLSDNEMQVLVDYQSTLEGHPELKDRCVTKVIELSDESYEDHFRSNGNYAIWSCKGVNIALEVDYSKVTGGEWEIFKISFDTDPSEFLIKGNEFRTIFDANTGATPLQAYISEAKERERLGK